MKYLFSFAVLSLLFACQTQEDQHDHANETPPPAPALVEEVALNLTQLKNIDYQGDSLVYQAMQSGVKLKGQVQAPPAARWQASSLWAGSVKHLEVQQGQRIQAGQVLLRLVLPEMLAPQREYARLHREISLKIKQISRGKALAQDSLLPLADLELWQSELGVLEQAKLAVEAELQLFGLDKEAVLAGKLQTEYWLRAEQSGVVNQIHIHPGAAVQAGQPLLELLQTQAWDVVLSLHEAWAGDLALGQAVEFEHGGKTYRAKVYAKGQELNAQDRSLPVWARIEGGAEGLASGVYVEAWLPLPSRRVPSLPKSAVVRQQGVDYVFLEGDREGEHLHFQPLAVRLGAEQGDWVELQPLDELPAKARYAHRGSFFIAAQWQKSQGGGGGHEH